MSGLYKLIQSCIGVGTNTKQVAVAAHRKNDDVKELFRLMLCPSILYNIKKVPETGMPQSNYYYRDFDLRCDINYLLDQDYRGKTLKDAVQNIYNDCTDELQQVFSWILARKNPAAIGKSIVNKVWPDLIRTQMYMGAVAGTDKSLGRLFKECPEVHTQRKEDGMCILIDYEDGIPVRGTTRQGNEIGKYFPVFMASLSKVIIKQGECNDCITGFNGMVHHEMFCSDTNRQTGNGLISKQVKNGIVGGSVDNCIHSVVLDIYDKDNPKTKQRYRYDNLIFFESDNTNRVQQWTVTTQEAARKITQEIIRGDGEGTVNKDPHGIFKNGKHWNNVKMKNEFVVDLQIIDYKEHSTKFDQIGSVLCMTKDNDLQVWVNLKTDADRKRCFSDYIGYIAKVKCESVIQSKGKKLPSLYLPRFDGADYNGYIRDDKTIADTYQEVLDQEAMSKGILC